MSEYTIHHKKTPKPFKRMLAFICPKHGFVKGDTCPDCAEIEVKRAPSINTGAWAKGWYEHLGPEPVYIRDKQHLRQECEKRGLLSRALMKPKSIGKGYENRR